MIKRIIADLHTHTDVSRHAYSTAYENIVAAKKAGLLAVAITNHAPAAPDGAPVGHFRNLRVIPRVVEGVTVLRGAELNLLKDGTVDLDDDTLDNRLDLAVASIHEECCGSLTKEQVTNIYLSAAENPRIHIIGHCGTSGYPFDHERVLKAFKENRKIVEVNEATFLVRPKSVPNCHAILSMCRDLGIRAVCDTDAHFCSRVGDLTNSIQMLNDIDFPEDLVINSGVSQFNRFLEETLHADFRLPNA